MNWDEPFKAGRFVSNVTKEKGVTRAGVIDAMFQEFKNESDAWHYANMMAEALNATSVDIPGKSV